MSAVSRLDQRQVYGGASDDAGKEVREQGDYPDPMLAYGEPAHGLERAQSADAGIRRCSTIFTFLNPDIIQAATSRYAVSRSSV